VTAAAPKAKTTATTVMKMTMVSMSGMVSILPVSVLVVGQFEMKVFLHAKFLAPPMKTRGFGTTPSN
jgi:hypothetical protein